MFELISLQKKVKCYVIFSHVDQTGLDRNGSWKDIFYQIKLDQILSVGDKKNVL